MEIPGLIIMPESIWKQKKVRCDQLNKRQLKIFLISVGFCSICNWSIFFIFNWQNVQTVIVEFALFQFQLTYFNWLLFTWHVSDSDLPVVRRPAISKCNYLRSYIGRDVMYSVHLGKLTPEGFPLKTSGKTCHGATAVFFLMICRILEHLCYMWK